MRHEALSSAQHSLKAPQNIGYRKVSAQGWGEVRLGEASVCIGVGLLDPWGVQVQFSLAVISSPFS